jgi:outer membrane lipoprotein-sorting protein
MTGWRIRLEERTNGTESRREMNRAIPVTKATALKLLLFALLVGAACCLFPTIMETHAASDAVDVGTIIKEVDELYRAKSSYSEIEMRVVNPHWERTLTMKAWTKGMTKTLVRITAPRKEEGVSTLRIGNEMWNYLPKTNKIIKIPPSMMMSSWMGSDFTNDDLVKEFSLYDDYTYEEISVANPDKNLVYINCIPREDLAVVWKNVIVAVRRYDHLPVWQKYFDEKDALMRTLNFSEITNLGGRTIPSVMEMIPENKQGQRTVIRYVTAEFDADLGEDIFSLRNLRSSD